MKIVNDKAEQEVFVKLYKKGWKDFDVNAESIKRAQNNIQSKSGDGKQRILLDYTELYLEPVTKEFENKKQQQKQQ